MDADNRKSAVLIVEDEVSLRTALHDKFTREGFTVHEARDGEEGLATALAERPQLILLDMMMPKMDGLTMLTLLRSTNDWGAKVPVLILTNFGVDDKLLMKQIQTDLATSYLVKSNWSIDQVITKVQETIARTA